MQGPAQLFASYGGPSHHSRLARSAPRRPRWRRSKRRPRTTAIVERACRIINSPLARGLRQNSPDLGTGLTARMRGQTTPGLAAWIGSPAKFCSEPQRRVYGSFRHLVPEKTRSPEDFTRRGGHRRSFSCVGHTAHIVRIHRYVLAPCFIAGHRIGRARNTREKRCSFGGIQPAVIVLGSAFTRCNVSRR